MTLARIILLLALLSSSGGIFLSAQEAPAPAVPAKDANDSPKPPAKEKPASSDSTLPLVLAPMIVVTASGTSEFIGGVPQTIQYFDQNEIRKSNATNIVQFFAQQSIGGTASISPDHSLFTLRGATSGQTQGWDDTSEIAILINGRPAGTANIGKLSAYDIDHVEILRGPSSVLYGSSAIGGVINLITKDGVDDPGNSVRGTFASFDHYTGTAESGGPLANNFDYYAEITGSTSGNYGTGAGSIGTEPNTGYQQGNIDLNLGYNINDLNRIDFTARHDGVYNAGHPGYTYSLSDYDNRYNTSADLEYKGSTIDKDMSWSEHLYYLNDVDEFHWSQNPLIGPVAAAMGAVGAPYITKDLNIRRDNQIGDKMAVTCKPIASNKLISGIDLNYTWIDNSRERDAAPGYLNNNAALLAMFPLNLAPTEYDSESYNVGIYTEDTQKFLDDKWSIKAGGRFDYINEKLISTPGQTPSFNSAVKESESFVYQAGSTYEATPWLTLRANVGTGFRAASPTELYAATMQGNGITFQGNPNLQNESSLGWEGGAHIQKGPFTSDLVYFENAIHDHITLVPVGLVTYQYQNVAETDTRGIEFQASFDIAKWQRWDGYRLEPYVNGTYNFAYSSGPIPVVSDDHIAGVNEYQSTFGLRGGKSAKWNIDFYGIRAGPSYEPAVQNTIVPATPPGVTYVGRIPSYLIFNTTEWFQVSDNVRVFFGVNNLLNKNYDSAFLALNNTPTNVAANVEPGVVSGVGVSAPGREYFGGFQITF